MYSILKHDCGVSAAGVVLVEWKSAGCELSGFVSSGNRKCFEGLLLYLFSFILVLNVSIDFTT